MIVLQAVADGVFKAELNNFLMKELAEDGYSGVEVRKTPTRTEVLLASVCSLKCPTSASIPNSSLLEPNLVPSLSLH